MILILVCNRQVRLSRNLSMWASQLIEELGVTLRGRIQSLCDDLIDDDAAGSDEDFTDDERSRTSSAATSDQGLVRAMTPDLGNSMNTSFKGPPHVVKGRRGSLLAQQTSFQARAKGGFSGTFNPLVTLDTEATQICLLATRLHWTATLVWALEQAKDNRHSLRAAQQEIHSWASKAYNAIVSKRKGKRSQLQQSKAQALVVLMMHLRDQTNEVLASRCRDTLEFGWLKHIRSYAALLYILFSLVFSLCFLLAPFFLLCLFMHYHARRT